MNAKKIWDSYKFPLLLLAGIFTGAVIGIIFGEKAKVLAPLGDIFLNLMFTIVVPMVYVSITTAVGNMVNMKRLGKILGSLVCTFVVTGAFAAVLVLIVVNIWPPAANTAISMGSSEMAEASSISEMIVGALTVDDFSGLMSRSNMLPIIVFAIMSGFAVAKCGGEDCWAGKLLNSLNNIIMLMVDMIMKLAPIGLGAYFANLVGEFGPKLIGDYGRTMLVYYPMCAVYVLIFFPLYSYFAAGTLGIKRMLKHIFNPAVTAFATQSSVATLPVNMDACKKIGFPAEAFPLIATIGFLVDPAATCLNASGDTIASMIIARLVEGKDWLEKRMAGGELEA